MHALIVCARCFVAEKNHQFAKISLLFQTLCGVLSFDLDDNQATRKICIQGL